MRSALRQLSKGQRDFIGRVTNEAAVNFSPLSHTHLLYIHLLRPDIRSGDNYYIIMLTMFAGIGTDARLMKLLQRFRGNTVGHDFLKCVFAFGVLQAYLENFSPRAGAPHFGHFAFATLS